jgi:ligand-binding sensor domain-containing protein
MLSAGRKRFRGWQLRALFSAIAALCIYAIPLHAGTNNFPHYNLRVWQTDDGLPQNSVWAIAQTKDGYLWVGTQHGLA